MDCYGTHNLDEKAQALEVAGPPEGGPPGDRGRLG